MSGHLGLLGPSARTTMRVASTLSTMPCALGDDADAGVDARAALPCPVPTSGACVRMSGTA